MKYFTIFSIAIKNALFYRGKIASMILLWFVRMSVLISVYSVAYKHVGHSLGNVPFETAIWAMAAYFVTLSLGMRLVYRDINDDIRFGAIETKITKPYDYLLSATMNRIGGGLPDIAIAFLFGIPFLIILVGVPAVHFSFLWIVQALLLFMGGTVLASSLYSAVGLLAFWIEDADPAFWIFDKIVLILGGSYVPVAMFPNGMKHIAEYSPFGATMFVTQSFNADFSSHWIWLFSVQLFWMIVMYGCLQLLFARAKKTLFVNGG